MLDGALRIILWDISVVCLIAPNNTGLVPVAEVRIFRGIDLEAMITALYKFVRLHYDEYADRQICMAINKSRRSR